ncbi:E3 ubiquitin-protein ligase [Fusarium oxysporum f. sp. albedinis]|nr:E3 ubiquitin-protein ligase [Fusarium oxysporum f. sp. albedinis]
MAMRGFGGLFGNMLDPICQRSWARTENYGDCNPTFSIAPVLASDWLAYGTLSHIMIGSLGCPQLSAASDSGRLSVESFICTGNIVQIIAG